MEKPHGCAGVADAVEVQRKRAHFLKPMEGSSVSMEESLKHPHFLLKNLYFCIKTEIYRDAVAVACVVTVNMPSRLEPPGPPYGNNWQLILLT